MLPLGHELYPRLPPELDVQIIGHLRNDLRALRRCSLVSTGWASIARPHKFRKITVSYHDDVVRLQAVLDADPGLGSFVRHVEIFPPVQFSTKLGGPSESVYVKLRSVGNRKVVTLLPDGKQALYGLARIDDTASTRLVVTTIQRFKSATKLSLVACHIFLHDLIAALGAMSGLQDLAMQYCDIIWGSAPGQPTAPSSSLPIQLRHVTIDPAPPNFCVLGGTYLAAVCFRHPAGTRTIQTKSLNMVYTVRQTITTGSWALGVLSEILEEVSMTFDLHQQAILSLHAGE